MKAVLFDMDGVLIDSEMFYMKGTYDWISKRGFKGKLEDTFRLIGTNMEGTYNLLYEMLNKKYTISEIEKENRKYFLEHPIDYKAILKPYVKEILVFLKKHKIKTAVCSSSPKKTIEKALKDCEILEYFDFIVSSDEVEKSKPDPDVYLKACEVLKVSKEDAFVIDISSLADSCTFPFAITVVLKSKLIPTRFLSDFSSASISLIISSTIMLLLCIIFIHLI